jgi:hypothetical protein
MPGTLHQRRICFSGRQLCGPWQPLPPEPSWNGPIIIERIIGAIAIIGAVTIIGIDTITGAIAITGTGAIAIIGTVAIIGIDTITGAPITVATIITTGIHIIGNPRGQRINLRNKAREKSGWGYHRLRNKKMA